MLAMGPLTLWLVEDDFKFLAVFYKLQTQKEAVFYKTASFY